MNTRRARLWTVVAAAAVLGSVGGMSVGVGIVDAGPGDFTVAPTSLSFPATYVGETAAIDVTVTNASSSSLTPNFAGGAPNDPTNFGGSQNCAGKTFAPGDSCTFTYEFHPASTGPWSSNTTIGIDSENFALSMTGTGLFPFDVSPTSLAFPDTAVGSTSTIDVVITNLSGASQSPNFSGGAPADPINFGGSQNCAGKTFAPGDSCTFTYEFHPASTGPWSSNTTIGIDSENFALSMTGTGTDTSATTTNMSTTTTSSPTATATTSNTISNTTTAATAASTSSPATQTVGVEVVPGPLSEGGPAVPSKGTTKCSTLPRHLSSSATARLC
jgi:hypothetical protein